MNTRRPLITSVVCLLLVCSSPIYAQGRASNTSKYFTEMYTVSYDDERTATLRLSYLCFSKQKGDHQTILNNSHPKLFQALAAIPGVEDVELSCWKITITRKMGEETAGGATVSWDAIIPRVLNTIGEAFKTRFVKPPRIKVVVNGEVIILNK
jgi:hypothetical protein